MYCPTCAYVAADFVTGISVGASGFVKRRQLQSSVSAVRCANLDRNRTLRRIRHFISSTPAVFMTFADKPPQQAHPPTFSRRHVLSASGCLLGACATSLVHASAPKYAAAIAAAATADVPVTIPSSSREETLEYRGPANLGFSFHYPAHGWTVKRKPIRTHMAELILTKDSGPATTSAGVTVDAVKINDIRDFGSPKDVGERVVTVEKRKDNVLAANLVSSRAIDSQGLLFYIIEYQVDSGRGPKLFVAKATVTGGNLFVFTAQAKKLDFENTDGPVLSAMVDSFTVQKQYA